MDSIVCPNCKKTIQITQALRHDLEEKIKLAQSEKHKEELARAKAQAEAETSKRLKEESQKELLKAIGEKEKLKKQLLTEEKERKEFEKKAQEQAVKEASEKSRLDKLEIEKKLKDTQEALEVAQRKAKQGSQQLQGEVLEIDLEEKLKIFFPNDEFLPVPKGFEGADLIQKVMYKERVMGSILWETKRTNGWDKKWLVKLKNDSAKISASEAIIVSQTLPDGITSFDRKDGIWITNYQHAINTCRYLRFLITRIASVKSSVNQTDEEWGKIRDYMMSDTFKHRMQSHFDSIKVLKDELDTEKRSTLLRWKKREGQIEKLDSNTINFYGELKDIVPNLPEIKESDSAQFKLED
ncbi:MAG: DUF2130 domain-containing protein [Candidatus Levybacteria bacterium]|nr:DUF2130 domain-containing protein [Candidatus Levybacteria bacterium]